MNKYNEDNIDRDIDLYTEEIFKLIDKIRNNLEYIDDSDYLDKLYSVLNPLSIHMQYHLYSLFSTVYPLLKV